MRHLSAASAARSLSSSLLVLGLPVAMLFAPVPAGAQSPWVGLSGLGAELLREQGAGRDAPGYRDHFGFALATGDFDGNGADDLAVGVPENDCNATVVDCGSAVVRWGVPGIGITAAATVLDQTLPGSPDLATARDAYGAALAGGDFNGDGYDDLAVGVPHNTVFPDGLSYPSGSVQLHFGVPGGISGGGYLLLPGAFGIEGVPQAWAEFGSALAFGDFNGDGRDDLAVGAPLEYNDPGDCFNCLTGSVYVIDSNAQGAVAGFKMIEGDQGLPDAAEDWELFGKAVAAGDFNHDGYDDLAIGVPQEDAVGAVLVVYGSPWSLLFANHWYFSQWDLGESPEPDDRFGEALAVGDFDHDGYDDLAIGVPGEDGLNGQPTDMGLVTVVYGSPGGLGLARAAWWWEDLLYGVGESESYDNFGGTLAAGDFDGDGVDDLAVGSRGEGFAVARSGAVTLMLGRAGQGLPGAVRRARAGAFPLGMIPDAETGAPRYGSALAAGDFDGNGFSDLAIGAPYREDNGIEDAGGVAVLYGNLFSDGFENAGVGAWTRAQP